MEEASTSLGCDDIIPATPGTEKLDKKLKRAVRKWQSDFKWQCDTEVIPPVQSENLMVLKNSIGSLKSHLYIFHSFYAVLNYKPKSKPSNNYIKIIGQYKTSRCYVPYIQGYEMCDQKFAIFLGLELVEHTPQINDVVEIFGHLEFHTVVNCDMPIIIVHFWVKLSGSIASYIQCLTMQKIFLPESAFEIEAEPKEVENDSLIEVIQDLSFGIISMGENDNLEI